VTHLGSGLGTHFGSGLGAHLGSGLGAHFGSGLGPSDLCPDFRPEFGSGLRAYRLNPLNYRLLHDRLGPRCWGFDDWGDGLDARHDWLDTRHDWLDARHDWLNTRGCGFLPLYDWLRLGLDFAHRRLHCLLRLFKKPHKEILLVVFYDKVLLYVKTSGGY